MNSRKPLIIMGLVISAFAGLALYAMYPLLNLAIEQYTWVRTDCTVNSSSIVSDQYGTDSLILNYSYSVDGVQFQGSKFEAPSSVSRSEIFYKQELERLVPGTNIVCFYNPEEKEQAVIRKVSISDAAFIIIPVIFLMVGLSMLYAGIRPETHERSLQSFAETEDTSYNWGRVVFFSLFILVGIGVTYILFFMPYLALQEAKNWNLAKCKINDSYISVSSSRDSKTGKTSNSYSLVVRYGYTVNGKSYLGDVYSPAGDRFLGSDKLYEIVNKLTKGVEVDCFIDPADNTRSALNRDFQDKMYFGLFPLIFVIAGLFGLIVTSVPREDKMRTMGYRMKSQSRVKNFVSYVFITIIWNAILGAVIYGVLIDSDGGLTSYLPLFIASPFILIGLSLVLCLPYVFLQIFNPTLDLELAAKEIHLGQKFVVVWKLKGDASRVIELSLDMKPDWEREADNSEDAKSSIKIKNLAEFKRLFSLDLIPAYRTTNQQHIKSGRCEFDIPSLEKLKELSPLPISGWRITARLSIPWFPDSQEMFTIPVYQEEELDEDELDLEAEEDLKEV